MILRTLTPFLSLVIAGILFLFVIQPKFSVLTETVAQVEEYKKTTADYQDFLKKVDNSLAIKESRSALENERIDAIVQNSIDTTTLLVDLESIAKKQRLLFGNVSVKEADVDFKKKDEVKSAELATADISFEVVGSYEQFKTFLVDLERSVTLFDIIEIKFTTDNENVFTQYKVTVRAYALPKS